MLYFSFCKPGGHATGGAYKNQLPLPREHTVHRDAKAGYLSDSEESQNIKLKSDSITPSNWTILTLSKFFFVNFVIQEQTYSILSSLFDTWISYRKPQQLINSSFIIEAQFSIHKTTRSFKCITEKYNKSARLENYFIFRMC